MICPACGGRDFARATLEGGLPAERCNSCHGIWVELDRYKDWRKSMPQASAQEHVGELGESNSPVRLCPVSGRIMTRVRVAHADPLLLDYSAPAQAVWFDQGEWERLVALGLHVQLDAIVSDKWQAGLKLAASQERIERAMRVRFGDAGYERLAAMRAWLTEQPNRSEMIAFLHSKTD